MSLANQIERPIKTKAPQGSLLFNTTKCIFLNFTTAPSDGTTTGTFQTTAYATVNIPHPVKEIIVRQINWACNADGSASVGDIGLMFGDIVGGGFIGTFNANNGSGTANPYYGTVQDIRHIYRTPKNISGSYQFTIQSMWGQPLPAASRTIAYANVVLEFVAASGVIDDVST